MPSTEEWTDTNHLLGRFVVIDSMIRFHLSTLQSQRERRKRQHREKRSGSGAEAARRDDEADE
jgi:hypothetical protein